MSCNGQPLPFMFVTKDFDHAVIGNFMKKKYQALCEFISKPEATYFYYSLQDFKALLITAQSLPDAFGMRMYFATWGLTGHEAVDSIVRQDYNDRMTIIYAPTGDIAGNTQDLGQYYVISPMGGVIEIPEDSAQKLFDNYKQNKVPLLETIIKDAGLATFRETVSGWLPLSYLIGPRSWIAEAECQGASGIAAFLGTYDKDYTIPVLGSAGWQMTLLFTLAKAISFQSSTYHYQVDIEDTDGYTGRVPITATAVQTASGDTINPCPPATNCGHLCRDCD